MTDTNLRSNYPLNLQAPEFQDAVLSVFTDLWLANPSALPSMSRFNEAIVKEIHGRSTLSNRNLTPDDLVREFRFSHGQAQYLARVLRDPSLDEVELSVDDRTSVRGSFLDRVKEGRTEITFYLEEHLGVRLRSALRKHVTDHPGPCPRVSLKNGCAEVHVDVGATGKNGQWEPTSEYEVFCRIIELDAATKPKRP